MKARLVRGVAIAAIVLNAGGGATAPGVARAERVRSGNVVMSLSGGIEPRRLPRHRAAPVRATLASRITTVDRTRVPRVRRIELAFSGASISSAGLPVCPRTRLRNATGTEAVRRCGGALIGRGRLPLEARFPGQLPLRRAPRVLVFNGRSRSGGRVLWMHVYAAQPPLSFVLPFHARRRAGSFGTVLSALVPSSVARWIRIGGFEVELGRRYRRHGRPRSYLSASCPVPKPFTEGFFPLVRVTYAFAGDMRVSNAIVRSCRAESSGSES